jgi:prepilin-type N-terminal cleavage/methylation domain-containing protein
MKSQRHGGDRGDTLIELLVAMVVMGIAVVAVTGGVAVSIRMSDIHRKQAQAGALIRDFAEAVENAVQLSPSAYVACAAAGAYDSYYTLPGSAFTVAAPTPVRYWDSATSTFTNTCTTDSGVQQLSLRINSADNSVSETLVIVIRKPCRSVADFPLEPVCN